MLRKNKLLILVFSAGFLIHAKAQDTLYYSVENVSEELSTNISSRLASNKDLKQFSEENERSLRLRKDKFLIPFILSQVNRYSIYKTVLPEEYAANITKSYRVLQIAINVFNNNIEYQFHLCDFEKSDYRILSISNFFINPDIPEYPNTMNIEIQKLFDGHGGTNKPPIAKIRIDGKLVNGDTTFYRSHQDTILMDGSSSSDEETPKKLIEYMWRVNKIADAKTIGNKDTNAYISDFKFEESQQKLVIKEPGKYIFSLEVSDGITWSVRDSVSIFISVINKPVLELHKSSYDKIYQGNIFNYLSTKDRLFKTPDSIGFNIVNFEPSGKMVFKYLHSNDKSRKFFLEIKPGSKENSVVLNYKPGDESSSLRDTSTVKISGLRIDTSQYKRSGSLYFWLNKKITPGNHRYLLFTDYKGVTSNYDTVNIAFREKSFINLYGGYQKYAGYKGSDYFNGFVINLFQFGIRFYITQRLSADLDCLFPQYFQDFSDVEDRKLGLNFISGKINYDIPTGHLNLYTGGLPIYFSGFLGGYNLQVSDNTVTNGFLHLGGGARIRVQLFANNSKMGIIYSEAESGWYKHFEENSYQTGSIGINLIYGLWRY